MRAAYVCTDPGVPVLGSKGASVHVRSVLEVLVRAEVQVHLLAAALGGPSAEPSGVTVHRLPLQAARSPAAREHAAQAADAAVRPALDAVDAQGPVHLVYERYALWGRTATAWAAEHGVPSVLEVNAPLVEEQARHRRLVDRAGAERVAREALSRAGTVVCVSDTVAAWARQRSRHPERVFTVPNGVDTRRFSPRRENGAAFTVGFVGTLKPWHGVEHLLDAFVLLAAEDPGWRLLLVGDGPAAAGLVEAVHRAGVADRVELTGAVPPERVADLLARMQVAVAPYPPLANFYFSPLKVYEYLAAGLPVVASRVGDLPRLLGEGRLGVLVEPGDPAALATALRALRADPARRSALGRAARSAAVREHDWQRVVGRTLLLAGSAHGH